MGMTVFLEHIQWRARKSLVSDTKLKHREMTERHSGHWRAKRTGPFHRTAASNRLKQFQLTGGSP